jgi:hypothetical protein
MSGTIKVKLSPVFKVPLKNDLIGLVQPTKETGDGENAIDVAGASHSSDVNVAGPKNVGNAARPESGGIAEDGVAVCDTNDIFTGCEGVRNVGGCDCNGSSVNCDTDGNVGGCDADNGSAGNRVFVFKKLLIT